MTRMANVEAGSKEWGLLGFYTQSSTWAQRLHQAALGRLEAKVLCRPGLAVLGWVRYHSKPGRTWVVWSGWVPGGIDNGGTGKLSLSAALSDPLLNLLEDVGDVEGQMVRRCRHHRTAGGERPEEIGRASSRERV